MEQLGELHDMYDEFLARGVTIVGIGQEEKSLRTHSKVLGVLGFRPDLHLLADVRRKDTPRYERVTAYLVDAERVVQQVFPMEIYERPPWWALLNEIDRLDAETAARSTDISR